MWASNKLTCDVLNVDKLRILSNPKTKLLILVKRRTYCMRKNNLFTKVLSTVLAGIVVLGTVACGNSEQASNQTEQSAATSEVQKETSTATEVKEEELTYPLDTDDELTMWCGEQMKVHSDYQSWKDSPFHSGLAEKTGVTVDWQYPTQGSNVTQAYNLLLASDELPDIIYWNFPDSGAQELIIDGLIYDLTDYLPKYAPDYWEYINRPENAAEKKVLMTDDGRFYNIPAIRETGYNITYIGPIIRQDWLDECGLEAPVTLEDWENVLVTFKEKYGARLGFRLSNFNNSAGIASGTGAYSGLRATLYVDDEDKIQVSALQPEWKEMMETLIKWWEMDLIDKDSLTMDNDAVRTKAVNGEIGITFVPLSQCNLIVDDAEAENNGAEWKGIAYPRTEPGAPTTMISGSANRTSGYGAVITTSCSEEKLKTALNWLNYGYTEEGIMYWNFGEEGVNYTLDSEGNIVLTELMTEDPLGVSNAFTKYAGANGSAPAIQLSSLIEIKNSKVAADAVYAWIENTVAYEHFVPKLILTEEENDIYADKWSALQTYMDEEILKFLAGDRDFSEYDDFVAQAEALGVQEVLDVQQAAYDRFISR